MCKSATFLLRWAGDSESPRFRYQRVSAGTGAWPLHVPFKEDVVNRIVVPGVTLPWSKTTFLLTLLLLCWPGPALLCVAEVVLRAKRGRERECLHQVLEQPLIFGISK